MPVSTVDNSDVDTAAGAISAPFGPLTRTGTTTDLDTPPMLSPNSDTKLWLKSAVGVDVYITYDQLVNAVVGGAIIQEAHGENYKLLLLELWALQFSAIINHANFNALTADPSYFQLLLRMVWALPSLLGVVYPFEAYEEVSGDKNVPLVCSMTLVDASDVATLTNNSTGLYHYGIVYWGDGHAERIDTPDAQPTIVHDYAHAAAATYTVRTVLIGPGGRIAFDTDTITVT